MRIHVNPNDYLSESNCCMRNLSRDHKHEEENEYSKPTPE